MMLVKRLLSGSALLCVRVARFATIFIALQGGILCLTFMFQCWCVSPCKPLYYTIDKNHRPVKDAWKITPYHQGNCINLPSAKLAGGIITVITDFMVVILPIRAVWNLQIPRRQQIAVMMLFGLGFFSCVASIMRTFLTNRVQGSRDSSWESYSVWIVTSFELYVGLVS